VAEEDLFRRGEPCGMDPGVARAVIIGLCEWPFWGAVGWGPYGSG